MRSFVTNILGLTLALGAAGGFVACGSSDSGGGDVPTDDTGTGADTTSGGDTRPVGDTGVGDTNKTDSTTGDTGKSDTATGDTGKGDTGAGDGGTGDTGAADGGTDSGAADTGTADTASADTAAADTDLGDTGIADTDLGDTTVDLDALDADALETGPVPFSCTTPPNDVHVTGNTVMVVIDASGTVTNPPLGGVTVAPSFCPGGETTISDATTGAYAVDLPAAADGHIAYSKTGYYGYVTTEFNVPAGSYTINPPLFSATDAVTAFAFPNFNAGYMQILVNIKPSASATGACASPDGVTVALTGHTGDPMYGVAYYPAGATPPTGAETSTSTKGLAVIHHVTPAAATPYDTAAVTASKAGCVIDFPTVVPLLTGFVSSIDGTLHN